MLMTMGNLIHLRASVKSEVTVQLQGQFRFGASLALALEPLKALKRSEIAEFL